MTTIQNPTIRYFTMFLANTQLGRGDTGAMANADMAMITKALFPNEPQSPNPGALLIQHFRHQSNKKKGDIRIGGLVTHLALARQIPLPILEPVEGSKLMDAKYLTSCGFIGVYRADKRLRAYQFGYVGVSRDEQVLLPCPPAFSPQGRDNWILTHDQVRDIVAQHQPDPEEGGEEEEEEQHEQYNAAWEGHQQQGGGAWDPWPNQPQKQHGNNYGPYNEFM